MHPTSPAKTLSDLIAIARSKPINFGSPGVGTSGHIANAYLFKELAKVEAVHVPFQGGAPAVNAMSGGHVDALVGAVPGYAGQLKSGLIRGIAVAAEKRLPDFPDIPTYGEVRIPRTRSSPSTWVGVFAPAKVGDAVADKLNKAINDVSTMPRHRRSSGRCRPRSARGTAPDAADYFRRDVEQWKKMITAIGLATR